MQFVAMLRGINVAGNKPVKMEALRACFKALGFNGIQTYVQSGNVIFGASGIGETALVKKIESKLVRDLGLHVPILLRTASDLSRLVKRNPFLRDKTVDPTKLHVTFLSEAPTGDDVVSARHLRKIHKPNSIPGTIEQIGSHLERGARLADASRTDERHDLRFREQCLDVGQLLVAADEDSRLTGKVVRQSAKRSQWREDIGNPGCYQLIHLFREGEIA